MEGRERWRERGVGKNNAGGRGEKEEGRERGGQL